MATKFAWFVFKIIILIFVPSYWAVFKAKDTSLVSVEIGSINKKSKRNAVSKFLRFCVSCLSKRRFLEVGRQIFWRENGQVQVYLVFAVSAVLKIFLLT